MTGILRSLMMCNTPFVSIKKWNLGKWRDPFEFVIMNMINGTQGHKQPPK